MWLINTETLDLHYFSYAQYTTEYAILSHCWGEDEMNFKDFRKKRNRHGQGFEKIESCCRFLRNQPRRRRDSLVGYEWVWIDTV